MKKINKFNTRNFDRMLTEAVKKNVRKTLREWVDDEDDDDELDPATLDRLNAIDRDNKRMGFNSKSTAPKPQDADFSNPEQDADIESDLAWLNAQTDEPQQETNRSDDDPLYNDAMDAIEMSDGDVTFEDWYEGQEGVDRNEAKAAFDKAMQEYGTDDEPEVETATEFSDRGMSQPSQNGEMLYDGVQITMDGNQYKMVAKENNPEIVIKGSNIDKVKQTYNSLWSDFGSMEDKARQMGQTNFHGALLWDDQYDSLVRSAGMHEENLPVVIDLDKIAKRNAGAFRDNDKPASNDMSWLEPYKHENGQYLMTDYQASRLSPEQQKQWSKLKRDEPEKYGVFTAHPDAKKK